MFKSLLFMLFALQIVDVQTTNGSLGYNQFEATVETSSQRMVMDSSSDSLLVGSINRLYKLSSDLQVEFDNITGPMDDNQACPPPPRSCSVAKTPTNNFNKVLVVDDERHQLIVCGSVYQGTCQILRLEDLSLVEWPSREVVTNTEHGTNVAFIAPGTSSGSGSVLYTAASRAMWLRNGPTVAKRVLHCSGAFDPTAGVLIPGNTIDETAAGNTFDINYINGFSRGHFSYFIATQLENFREVGSPLYTKIVRLCNDDSSGSMVSYIELPLVCKDSNGVNYNIARAAFVSKMGTQDDDVLLVDDDVLFVAFSKDGYLETAQTSVICMYPLRTINERFLERIRDCANQGTDTTEIDWLGSSTCVQSPELIDLIDRDGLNYCHRSDTNSPLGGLRIPIEARSIYTADNSITAILATPHEDQTAIFLGSKQGHLLKLSLSSMTEARLYEDIPFQNGQEIVKDGLLFNKGKGFVYVLQERKITKVPVETCGKFISCEECVNVGDPYCGWCSLKNKCSTRASCVYSSRPNNWLRNRPCISIVDLFPNGSRPIMDPLETVTLTFQLLPQLSVNETYGCRFDELPVTYGITNGQSIQCRAPAKADIPVIPPQEDHVVMLLGVFSSGSMVTFISTTFSYFDCTRHMTCGACVLSDWNCDWCVFDNACTHQSSICTHGDTIVTGNNNPVSSPRQGLDFCPQIRPQTTQILIPVGTSKDFVVNVRSLPDPTKVTGYQCSLLVEGTTQITRATLMTDDVIRCHGRMYSYEADDKSELIVPLRVHWNGDKQLERNNNTVTLYKCDVDRPDCSRCLSVETARPELGCRWCGTKCHTECPSSSLSPGSQCPAPVLKHVFPASGPVEGNTVIEINGSDIGQSFQDIQRVMIGNQICSLTGWYVTGQSVRCITSPLSSSIAQTVTVSVARTAGVENLISTGAVQFTYKDPAITGISPIEGYADGGTILTITGTDLDIGRDIQVNVAANVTCDITSVTSTTIRCCLGISREGHVGRVEVTFDGTPRSSADIFTFVPLPDILRFDPQSSIQSGGRVLTVYGRRFTVVSSATIKVQYKNDTFKQSCHVESAETMLCTTPAIADIVPITNCTLATLGLDVDGKQLFIPSPGFTYCQNPIVQKFDGDELLVDSANISSLTMKVEMTSWAITDSEIMVTLGGEAECQFVTLTPDVLTCRLPYNQPPDQAVATVRWYGNGSFRLGKVVYTNVGLTADVFALITAIVVVMLLIISVLVTIKYCRQKRRLKRVTQEYNERLLARIRGLHEDILEAAEGRRVRKLSGTKVNIRAKAKNNLPPKSIVLNEHVNIVPGDLHIKFSQLDMGGILGQGAFGRVFQAVLNNAQIGTGQTVAVKTVQDTTDSTNVIKFLQEGLLMKNFDHPNVLGLIGLTFNPDGQPVVVLPFMPNGDLKSYVVKNKQELTHNQLLKFASHVAHGMEYLGKAKFVHRDLAARNCMVDDKLVVKIADFGLSRDLSEADYYTSGDKHAKLPIKWMAPESMERRVYNAKTDVWSYGVLLWELFSGGRSPYPGIRNRDIYDFLKRGERMDPPRFCHIKISEIMQKCWRDSPKSRCSFREIVGEFDQLLTTITPGDAPPLPATPRDGQGERYTGYGKGSIIPMDVIENKGGGKREKENVVGNQESGECGKSGNGDGEGYLIPTGNYGEARVECTGVDRKGEVTFPRENSSLNENRGNWDEWYESGNANRGSYLIPTGNTKEAWEECMGVDREKEVTSPRENSSLNENRGNWDECNESGNANRGSYLIPTGNTKETWEECTGVDRKGEVTSPRENSSLKENRGTCDECTGSEYRNSYLIPMMEENGQGNYGDHC